MTFRCWTPTLLASAFCARDRRIKQSASFKHGTGDVEQMIANCAEGVGMTRGVHGCSRRIGSVRESYAIGPWPRWACSVPLRFTSRAQRSCHSHEPRRKGYRGYFRRDGDAAATGKDDPKLHLAKPALCDAEIASALRVRNDMLVPLVSMGWSNEAA
jgi:hypothetical protein